jgi:threonine dehydrogenase-like Zn-dependent dehydrogenase
VRALTVIPGKEGTGAVRDVADPRVRDGEALIEVIRVGIDGTDSDIARGEYGTAPPGSELLVIGHEALGRVARGTGPLGAGTLVVASVRRPDGCPNCLRGESDMCLWGTYTERGISGLDGYCAERYAERPEFLFAIAPELAGPAVLLEPLTIGEKGWRHVAAAQRRMTVWEPKRALVLGAGTVGILAAVVLRLRGLDVTVVDRRDKPERRALVATIGATYAATSTTTLGDIAGDGIDLAFEATGSAEVAFAAMNVLARNGALILASVTGGHRAISVPAEEINQRLVLRNALVIGTVNANRMDFEQGIADMAAAEKKWPGFLGSLITRRVPLERAAETLTHDPAQIKQVVEIGAQ